MNRGQQQRFGIQNKALKTGSLSGEARTASDPAVEACRGKCKKLLSSAMGLSERILSMEYELMVDGLPLVLKRAIEQSDSVSQLEGIVRFCSRWSREMNSAHEEYRKKQNFSLLAGADPGLFFSWCRQSLFQPENTASFRTQLLHEMQKRLPCRGELNRKIGDFVIRKTLGDHSALSPVLCGPPGCGKTQAIMTLADALTVCGLKTGFVHHPMNQSGSGEKTDESFGRLLGTSKQWSNGTSGQIYEAARANDLVLVFLDEAEKGGNRDLMVALLDPQQPLRDNFVQEMVGEINMRHKTVFILAVNDYSGLNLGNSDPLWSRLEPVEISPYTDAEMAVILSHKIQIGKSPFQADPGLVRELTRKALKGLGPQASLRRVESLVNEMLYRQTILKEPTSQATKEKPTVIHLASRSR